MLEEGCFYLVCAVFVHALCKLFDNFGLFVGETQHKLTTLELKNCSNLPEQLQVLTMFSGKDLAGKLVVTAACSGEYFLNVSVRCFRNQNLRLVAYERHHQCTGDVVSILKMDVDSTGHTAKRAKPLMSHMLGSCSRIENG